MARFYRAQRAVPRGDGRTATARRIHLALNHRPTVIGAAAVLWSWRPCALSAWSASSCMPQTDEGEVNVNAELARRHAHRAHRGGAARGSRRWSRQHVPEADDHHHQRRRRRQQLGGGGGGGGSTQPRPDSRRCWSPRDQRTRTNEEIAHGAAARSCRAARRRRARQSGRRQLPDQRFLSGGGGNNQDGQPPAARDSRPRPRRCAAHRAGGARRMETRRASPTSASAARKAGPRSPCASIARRPRCSGMTVASVADHDSDERRRHHRGAVPRARQRVSDRRAAARSRSRGDLDVGDVLLSTPTGQVVPAKNVHGASIARPARCRSTARTWSASPASTRRPRSR